MSEGAANKIGNAGVVVFGDCTTVVHTHTTPGGQPATPEQNTPVTDALPADSGEDELRVVDKVSTFIRQDLSSSFAKVNKNPLDVKQTPLEHFFINPHIKRVDDGGADHPTNNRPVLMYEVFETNSGSGSTNRVLLYGDAGTGKTTSCKKYTYDWANSREPFARFKIVIYLELSKAQGTLHEILEREVFCKRLTEDEKSKFFSYMTKHPGEFLFLLDGVSECNLDKLSDVRNFLFDKEYRGVYVIATSRPELAPDWFEMSNTFHMRYTITGFSEANVKEYFSQSATKCDTLNENVDISDHLKQLGQVPLLLLTICELRREENEFPTLTRLLRRYSQFVLQLFKVKSHKDIATQNVLNSLEKLAVLGVQQTKTLFIQDDLDTCKVDAIGCSVGFLSVDFAKNKSYKFANEKIQQYFAAKWIAENWASKKAEEILEKLLCDSETNYSVLVFIAGLFAEKKDGEILLKFLHKLATPKKDVNIIEDSCYGKAMDLLLASVYEAWRNNNSCMNERILHLFEGFEPFRKTKTPNSFPLRMRHEAAQGLAIIVLKLRLPRLNLSCIVIPDEEAKVIAAKCLRNNSFIETVKFSHSCLDRDAVNTVCESFASMVRLKEIDLSCCNFDDKGLEAIAYLIKEGKGGITSLQLGNQLNENYLQKEERSKQVTHLLRENSLSNITDLSKFQTECKTFLPSDETIQRLITAVEAENDLEDLSLPSSCVGHFIHQWLKVFAQNKELKRVKLHLKGMDESLQESLVEVANNMTQLERMSVVLEVEESDRTEFLSHSSLAKRTGDKLHLSVRDHTHSVKDPLKALTSG